MAPSSITSDQLLDFAQGRLAPRDMRAIAAAIESSPAVRDHLSDIRHLYQLIREGYAPEPVRLDSGRDREVGSLILAFVDAVQAGIRQSEPAPSAPTLDELRAELEREEASDEYAAPVDNGAGGYRHQIPSLERDTAASAPGQATPLTRLAVATHDPASARTRSSARPLRVAVRRVAATARGLMGTAAAAVALVTVALFLFDEPAAEVPHVAAPQAPVAPDSLALPGVEDDPAAVQGPLADGAVVVDAAASARSVPDQDAELFRASDGLQRAPGADGASNGRPTEVSESTRETTPSEPASTGGSSYSDPRVDREQEMRARFESSTGLRGMGLGDRDTSRQSLDRDAATGAE